MKLDFNFRCQIQLDLHVERRSIKWTLGCMTCVRHSRNLRSTTILSKCSAYTPFLVYPVYLKLRHHGALPLWRHGGLRLHLVGGHWNVLRTLILFVSGAGGWKKVTRVMLNLYADYLHIYSTALDWKACTWLRDFLSILPKVADRWMGAGFPPLAALKREISKPCKPFRPTLYTSDLFTKNMFKVTQYKLSI